MFVRRILDAIKKKGSIVYLWNYKWAQGRVERSSCILQRRRNLNRGLAFRLTVLYVPSLNKLQACRYIRMCIAKSIIIIHITLLEKYPTFFCEILVDLNEARLHEKTLNLHTHAWISPRLLIASVDGKQHLSEVVFSALVGFSL